jgi:hypothetical protein
LTAPGGELYGANISDLLTRATNPFLDVLAWLPYGVIHFVAPMNWDE